MGDSIDRDKFVPISRLCSEYNKISDRSVSENTLRKYLKDYSEHFNIVHDGQQFVELIPALEVIKRIRSIISSGRNKGRHEVLEVLSKPEMQKESSLPEQDRSVLSEDDWDKIYEAIAEAAEACVEARLKKMKGGVKDECG